MNSIQTKHVHVADHAKHTMTLHHTVWNANVELEAMQPVCDNAAHHKFPQRNIELFIHTFDHS